MATWDHHNALNERTLLHNHRCTTHCPLKKGSGALRSSHIDAPRRYAFNNDIACNSIVCAEHTPNQISTLHQSI